MVQNAEQFPQLGNLHGVGGQDGGEFVFFLKQENRLQNLSGTAKDRQQELEHLRQMENEAKRAKEKEQARHMLAESALWDADFSTIDKWTWRIIEAFMPLYAKQLSSDEKVNIYSANFLTKLNLPVVEKITSNDFLNIRKNEDVVNEWQLNLRNIIRQIDKEGSNPRGVDKEFLLYAEEQFMKKAYSLRESSKKRSLGNKFSKFFRYFWDWFCIITCIDTSL